jgi:hypothetical protein
MFVVSEEEVAAIRAAFDRRSEFAAAVELRRWFPGISDNGVAARFVKLACVALFSESRDFTGMFG